MEIKLEIPDYTMDKGLQYNWQVGFEIGSSIDRNSILISANRAGLISLANHLLNLAQDGVPPGHHMHFDEINSLNDGSVEIIIQKI